MMTDIAGDAERNLSRVVSALAAALDGRSVLSAGDRASLRRMDARYPAPAFFKLEGLFFDDWLPGEAGARADSETRWATILVGLSHLGALHRPGARLGEALAAAEYSEVRFARLVRADPDRLADELPNVARYLTAKNVAVDWTGAAQLILSACRHDEEPVRRHLARDYFGALVRTGHART